MLRKPHRVVNPRAAVYCVVYPVEAVEVRTPEMSRKEILEVLPVKRRLPGDAILKKMAKEREKEKAKRMAARVAKAVDIDPEAVKLALAGIMADLER